MGKVAVFCETSVVAHTIAFQAILAKKKAKKLRMVNSDNFLVYDGKKLVLDPPRRVQGATHTASSSHSRKSAHTRAFIVLYSVRIVFPD